MAVEPMFLAESILISLERRDWVAYQRYLAEYERQHSKLSSVQRLNYQEFRTRRSKHPNNSQGM